MARVNEWTLCQTCKHLLAGVRTVVLCLLLSCKYICILCVFDNNKENLEQIVTLFCVYIASFIVSSKTRNKILSNYKFFSKVKRVHCYTTAKGQANRLQEKQKKLTTLWTNLSPSFLKLAGMCECLFFFFTSYNSCNSKGSAFFCMHLLLFNL